MKLNELKALVLTTLTKETVRNFGDLRKTATWEAALASIDAPEVCLPEVPEPTGGIDIDGALALEQACDQWLADQKTKHARKNAKTKPATTKKAPKKPTLKELKITVLLTMTSADVRKLGDLRKTTTWEKALELTSK